MTRARARNAGFTLVELMVVVAILGILAASAIIYTGKTDETSNGARELHGMLTLARKLAVNHGTPSIAGFTSGARAVISATASVNYVSVEELTEDIGAGTAEWTEVSSLQLHRDVEIFAIDTAVNLDGGATTSSLSSKTLDNGDSVAIEFTASGGVSGAGTIYLRHRTNSNGDQYRLFMLPLTGTPTVVRGW